MDTSLATLEDHGKIVVVRFKPRDRLFGGGSRAITDLWGAFDDLQIRGKAVVVFRLPRDYFSSTLVDDFWRQAKEAPNERTASRMPPRPRMVAVADYAIKRGLEFLRSIRAFTIVACEGEFDFDLLGMPLACRFRICTGDSTFVNRTFARGVAPGSGTPWFLTRLLGYGQMRRLYLGGATLSADRALELGIVDQISEPESIEQDSLAVAERIAGYDITTLESVRNVMELVGHDFATYIEQGGTGFRRLPG